jgi:hypothetical protein
MTGKWVSWRQTMCLLAGLCMPGLPGPTAGDVQRSVSTAEVPQGSGWVAPLRPAFASALSPVRLTPGFGPIPFPATDGKIHLDYELYLTNRRLDPVTITRVQVVDAGDHHRVLLDLKGPALNDYITSALDKTIETSTLAGASESLLYIDITVPLNETVPPVLTHRIHSINEPDGEANPVIEGAFTRPLDMPVPVLASPFAHGDWIAAEGCCYKSHHRRPPLTLNGQDFLAQRYAIDFIKVVNGKLWRGNDPSLLSAWYTYGEDVLAVIDGTISSILNDEDDITPFQANPKPRNVDNITGNHIIIDAGNGRYVVYAHLMTGSIKVKVGDAVHVGDKLARAGNSGNTDAPHLHLHVMDDNHPVQSHGLPFVFRQYQLLGNWGNIDRLLPEPFGQVPPQAPLWREQPEQVEKRYPLELDILRFGSSSTHRSGLDDIDAPP